MSRTRKFLAIILTVLTLMSVISAATPVIAAEVTEATTSEELLTEETTTEEYSTEEASTEENSTEEASTEKISTEENSTEEALTEGFSMEELTSEEASAEENSTEEASTEEAQVEENQPEDWEITTEASEITEPEKEQTDDTETDEVVTESSEKTEPQIIGEVIEWRSESTKYFRKSDGSYTAAQYNKPIHYNDNGEWKEIDNTLTEVKLNNSFFNPEKEFVAENTNTPAKFPDELKKDDNKVITVTAGGYDISFSPEESQKGLKNADGKIKNSKDLESVKILEKAEAIELGEEKATFSLKNIFEKADTKVDEKQEKFKVENKSGAVVYEDVFKNVDLEYELNNSKLKESIVLKEQQENYVFRFNMDIDGLYPVTCEDGSINLCKDEEGKNPVAKIEAPYMLDSAGAYSDSVTMVMQKVENEYILTVTADAQWLNATERVYPVVIDPTIDLNISNDKVFDCYVDTSEKDYCFSGDVYLYAGYSHLGLTRTYIKFILPELPDDNYIITNSFIEFWQKSASIATGKKGYLTLYKVKDEWDSAVNSTKKPTWNNQPQMYKNSDEICPVLDYAEIKHGENISYYFDITRTVKEWYENEQLTTNNGFVLKSKHESFENRAQLYSTQNSAYGLYPAIYVDFRNNKGLEGYWDYSSFGVGSAGTAHVNDFTGNLVYEMPLASSVSEIMPVNLVAYYNNYMAGKFVRQSKSPNARTCIGRGFRLNYQQSVYALTSDDILGENNVDRYPYVYTDGDGTEHYIQKVTEDGKTVYKDEDGLGLTLLTNPDIDGATYQINDKAHNKYYFNDKGNLYKIKDRNGNAINITFKSGSTFHGYENGERISRITDGAGHTFTFSYYGDENGVELDYVRTITDDAGRQILFTVSGSRLSEVLYPDKDKLTIDYQISDNASSVEEGRINQIVSNNTYKINFDYTSKATGRRVKKVKEYGVNERDDGSTYTDLGQEVSFDRSKYNTTVIRSSGMDGHHISRAEEYPDAGLDDIITTMQFDNMGRNTSQHTQYGTSEVISSSASSYSSSDKDESTSGFKNKVSGGGSVGKHIRNLIYNGNAESLTGWAFKADDNVTASSSVNNDSSYIGKKSIKLTISSVNNEDGRCYFRKDYTNIKKNEVYTLSAYVKTGYLTPYSNAALTGAFIQLIAYNDEDEALANPRSTILTQYNSTEINNGWRRLSTTITIPDGAKKLSCYLFLRNAAGSVSFDAIQLEKGAVANDYNMLENSGFEDVDGIEPKSWSGTSQFTYVAGSNGVRSADGPLGGTTKVFMNTGAAGVEKGVAQTVAVAPNPKDTYILSGWAKGYPINSTFHKDADNNPNATFEIAVKVTYKVSDGTTVDEFKPSATFNTTITGWQCATTPIVLKYSKPASGKTYTPQSIKIIPRYHNQENFVFFDNIMLVKDVASSYTYDNEGNLISSASNGEQKANMQYDDNNNLTSYTDTAGNTTTLSYDDTTNNLTLVKSPKGVYTDYDYDSHGNITNTETRNNQTDSAATASIRTTNKYSGTLPVDSLTLNPGAYLIESRDQNGNVTKYERYKKSGLLNIVTAPNSSTTSYTYCQTTDGQALGKLSTVTSTNTSGSSKVAYSYNENQALEKITFGNTKTEQYSFEYDGFGNVKKTKVGTQVLSTNTYKTNNGPLIKTLYGNNYLKHYYYNNLGLVRSIRGKASGATAETELYNFEYNSAGTQTAYIDKVNNTKILYDYDSLGRLRSTETVTNTNAFIGLAEYGYDSRNNLTRLATLYDGAPREEKFYYIQVSGNEHSDDYEKDNLPTRYQVYDSRYALYSYDSLNRLTERKFTLNAPLYYNYLYKASDRNSENSKKYQTTQVAEEFIGNDVYGYTYGIMGNITHIKTAQRTGSAGNSSSHSTLSDYVSYKYDKLGQLTEENFSGGRKTQWTYDELGNITSKVVTKNGTTKTIAYQYGAGTYNVGTDEETSSWNYLLTEFDGKTITYDKIGNPTSYLGATLTWSGRQLDSYTKGTNAITYTYNSDGLRTSKTVNGLKSDYYYVNGRLHYEKRSDGSSLRFFYDSNGYLTVIEHKTTAAGIKSYYVATNLRGDVVGIYLNTGKCIATYEYDAWGNTLSVKDASNNDITDAANIANVNPIRYRGYYYDADTKLYYLQSRYYNPEVGRFLNADGYITTGQGVLSYNMFAYCMNNPIRYIDPTGRSFMSWLENLYNKVDNFINDMCKSDNRIVAMIGLYCRNKFDEKTHKTDIERYDKIFKEQDRVIEQYTKDAISIGQNGTLTDLPNPVYFSDVEAYKERCLDGYGYMQKSYLKETIGTTYNAEVIAQDIGSWDFMMCCHITFRTCDLLFTEMVIDVGEMID